MLQKLKRSEWKVLNDCLRVSHAGEMGANYIYSGQMKKIDIALKPLIKHMKDQEMGHLNKFNELVPMTNTRPSMLLPIWKASGYILGYGTAMFGKEMAMLCTEAVETAIGQHYNDQLRELIKLEQLVDDEVKPFIKELQLTISKFRDEELEHKDIAEKNDALKAPFYQVASKLIQGGCWTAIEIAKRI